MNPGITLGNLLRAAKSNPAARPAHIWQLERDDNGAGIILPDGSFKWELAGLAVVVFQFRTAEDWAGATGEYAGRYKVNVIMNPKTPGQADQPSLADTFMIENLRAPFGDGWPKWTVPKTVSSMSSTGLSSIYEADVADPADLTGIPGA